MSNLSQESGALINIEAEPFDDLKVASDTVGHDLQSLYGHDWKNVVQAYPPLTEEVANALAAWLGDAIVRRLRNDDISKIRYAISKLKTPAPSDSFVWDSIKNPEDVRKVAQAIKARSGFDELSVSVSKAVGGNEDFKSFIHSFDSQTSHKSLMAVVESFDSTVTMLTDFISKIDAIIEGYKSVFSADDLPVEAILALLAASDGIKTSMPFVSDDLRLSRVPTASEYARFAEIRQKVIAASNHVKSLCYVSPVNCSFGILAGVIRALAEKRAADFVFAIEALGGRLDSKENINETSRAFVDYFHCDREFIQAALDAGFQKYDIPALISQIAIRKHIQTAAEQNKLQWENVDVYLQLKPDVCKERLISVVSEISGISGVSGRLLAICNDKNRSIKEVRDSVYLALIEREYFLQVAKRVVEINSEISIDRVRDILALEQSLNEAEARLLEFGVETMDQMIQLEAHLEWMCSAFALPVPDTAIHDLIVSRAQCLPFER